MIPAGYMAKTIVRRPDYIHSATVEDVYSVSGCISPVFADYVSAWKHNGYWLFNSRDEIVQLARAMAIDISDCRLLYYELFEREFNEETKSWTPFGPEPSLLTDVRPPQRTQLRGYDVATFWARNIPECSPLSCNSLASEMSVNKNCLFDSFDDAYEALKIGKFDKFETGPFRIFAVYSVESPAL